MSDHFAVMAGRNTRDNDMVYEVILIHHNTNLEALTKHVEAIHQGLGDLGRPRIYVCWLQAKKKDEGLDVSFPEKTCLHEGNIRNTLWLLRQRGGRDMLVGFS